MNTFSQVYKWSLTPEAKSILTPELHESYELHTLEIERCCSQQMKKTYDQLQLIYAKKQQTARKEGWQLNQRKTFMWFIVYKAQYHAMMGIPITKNDWKTISKTFFNKNQQFLQFEYLNMLKKSSLRLWQPHQDQLLADAVRRQMPGKWKEIARNVFYSSKGSIYKSPKHCRERWINYLDPSKVRGAWTDREDIIILEYVISNGHSWCKLVPILHRKRTELSIKNRFYTLLRKAHFRQELTEVEKAQKILLQKKQRLSTAMVKEEVKEQASYNKEQNHHADISISELYVPVMKEEGSHDQDGMKLYPVLVQGAVEHCVKEEEIPQQQIIYPFLEGNMQGSYHPNYYSNVPPFLHNNIYQYSNPPFPLPLNIGNTIPPPPTTDRPIAPSNKHSHNKYHHDQL